MTKLNNLIGSCDISAGADVHAKDKGGLVPLHNSSSYGHQEVSQLLIKAGANVNASGEL